MGGFGQYFDIILFAMIAGFLVLRLRSVLGRRTGFERRRDPFAQRAADKVMTLSERGKPALVPSPSAPPADTVAAGLAALRRADPGFIRTVFSTGRGPLSR